jgi:hypothetical protein
VSEDPGAPLMTTAADALHPSVFDPVMREFLGAVSRRLVVVGSVARTIRETGFRQPKDIDLLIDLDSQSARADVAGAVSRFGLKYESPFLACWTFRDYGWMVEIISIHVGPAYRAVRRRAEPMSIAGVSLLVARADDAPPMIAERR